MFEKVTESWAWTADVSLLSALALPLLVLLAAPLSFFFIVHIRKLGLTEPPTLILRGKENIRKRHKVAGLIVGSLIAVLGLSFGVSNSVSWAAGDRETSGNESRSYLTFEGKIESSKIGGSTFFSDSANELWIRAEGHPDLLLKIKSANDVAKFYDRTDVDSGKLYCKIPEEGSKSLVCASDKTDIQYDIENPLRSAPDDLEVEHTTTSEEWDQSEAS